MSRTLVVETPCMIQGIRIKQRKTKWHHCRVTAPVEIAEVAAVDNPNALVTSYERFAKIGPRVKETVRQAVAGHDGCLWRPVPGPYEPLSRFADLQRDAALVHWRQYPFGRPAAGALPTHTDMLMVMREIRKDTSEWAIAKAARTASNLLLVGENLYRRDIEPVWLVTLGPTVEIDFHRPFPGRVVSGIPFPMSERGKAETAARALAEIAGAKFKNSGMIAEIADQAFLSATADNAFIRMMSLAFVGARQAIRRGCRGPVGQHFQDRFDAFNEASGPGGDICIAAEMLDALECSALDISDGHSEHRSEGYGRDRAPMGGGWKKCAMAALSVGAIGDIIGGETLRPDMDSEDEDALYALGA